MTDEQIALARRAVACEGWRWMPGMTTSNGGRVFAVDEDGSCRLDFGAEEVPFWCTPETMRKMTPDLTDAATLGCVLALVREAWVENVVTRIGTSWWEIEAESFLADDTHTASFTEALVSALEAAP